jgi:hypothetical protein
MRRSRHDSRGSETRVTSCRGQLKRQINCRTLSLTARQQKSSTESPEAQQSGVSNIACPPLFPPLHGYLECSRPVESANDSAAGRLKITNRPGSQCVLQCPTRFGFSSPRLPRLILIFVSLKVTVLRAHSSRPVAKMETGTATAMESA